MTGDGNITKMEDASISAHRKKVGVILHGFHGGGAERVVANLISRIAENHDVTAMLLEAPDSIDYPVSEKVHQEVFLKSTKLKRFAARQENRWKARHKAKWERARKRGNVRAMQREEEKLGRRQERRAKGMSEPRYVRIERMWRIWKFRRKERFDVTLGFLEQGNFLAVMTRGFGKSCVSVRNHATKKLEAHPMPKSAVLHKRIDRFASEVICVSEEVAHDEMDNFGVPARKIRIINNWVDRGEVEREAEQPIDDPEFDEFVAKHPVLIVNSGRLDSQKGQWHLIRAFRELHKTHPETGLVILGGGWGPFNLEEFLREQITANGMEADVLLAGRKSNPFAYMKRSDIFVLSSLFEGFSNVVIEAMAVKLPVICTDCSGVRELLTPDRAFGDKVDDVTHGDFGIVVPELGLDQPETLELTQAEDSLMRAMTELVEDSGLRKRYAQLGYDRLEAYKPEVIMKKWLEVIEEA